MPFGNGRIVRLIRSFRPQQHPTGKPLRMTLDHASSAVPRVRWLSAAVLTGLVVAVYWPVAGYEFVNWDDPWYVLKNPLIRSWHPSNLWRIATEMSVKNYAPLTTLSLLIDHTLFGLDAGGYHATNVVLHAVNAMLVCALVGRLSGRPAVGLVTAALFAVHPIQIETVAWVSSRKTLLCSLFMLASGLCWLKRDRAPRDEMWGTLFLGLALLAKAAAIVIPPIVIGYDVLFARKRLSESIASQLVPAFLCVLLLSVTMTAQNLYMGGVRGHLHLSKWHILGLDSIILWRYVGMLCLPVNLSLLYDPPTSGVATSVGLSLIGWGAVCLLSWRWRQTHPGLAFAVLCWFCLLAPVLNLFPITTLMNDRYLYLPCLSGFALAAVVGQQLVDRCRPVLSEAAVSERVTDGGLRMVVLAVVAAAITGYSAASMQRLPVWQNDLALWRTTVGQVPQLAVVQIQWADALRRNGKHEAAEAALRLAAARCHPDAADRQRIADRLSDWSTHPAGPRTSFVSIELATPHVPPPVGPTGD